jgi:hypothetical protein
VGACRLFPIEPREPEIQSNIAEIGSEEQVAAFVQLLLLQTGPLAIHLAVLAAAISK